MLRITLGILILVILYILMIFILIKCYKLLKNEEKKLKEKMIKKGGN